MVKIQRTLSLLLCLAVFGACAAAKSPAEKAARGFMDAYYVDADLKKAAEFSDSLALEKVSAGMNLRDGLTIDEAAHHPKIHYKLEKATAGSDQAEFLFDVEFHPEKAEAFHKSSRIVVRLRDGGLWKVTQFSDHDPL
ncbi:MAG TPA: hypothetical protein VFX30_04730 [bacterium]|nr:hypothetical protein [bacterium]